jgi:hypothetical protein
MKSLISSKIKYLRKQISFENERAREETVSMNERQILFGFREWKRTHSNIFCFFQRIFEISFCFQTREKFFEFIFVRFYEVVRVLN